MLDWIDDVAITVPFNLSNSVLTEETVALSNTSFTSFNFPLVALSNTFAISFDDETVVVQLMLHALAASAICKENL